MAGRSIPPGLDYRPVCGGDPNLSFGVVQNEPDAKLPTTAEAVVFRRAFPVQRPASHDSEWVNPTCEKIEVLLPPGASDELWDPQALCRAFDRQSFAGLRDVAIVITLRFPEIEAPASIGEGTPRLHECWHLASNFAAERLVKERRLAVIPVLHVPSRAARPGPPHLHLLALARQLLPSGFGQFSQPLASDEGREIVEKEWAEWRARNGQ